MTGKRSWLVSLVVVGLLLALWEGLVRLLKVEIFVLPAPSVIAASLVENFASLLPAIGITLAITWIALVAAVISGVALAWFAHRSRVAEAAIMPLAITLQVTPIVAIAPLIIIWAGVEEPARALIIIAWIVAFFPVLTTMRAGLAAIPRELDDLHRLHGSTGWKRFTLLEVPASLPALLSGLKVASGLALIGAVVGEFAAGSGTAQGLAWRLLESQYRLDMPKMFACLVLLALIGIVQHALLAGFESLALRQRGLAGYPTK
jgi:NitT/TauT family transport system permease protein